MRKENFNFMTNIFILILLFLSGLSYADTNGIWQFANDTRGGTFGGDEQGVTSQYTFINPVYFNLGLHSTALSTFTDLRANLFNANSATIATQLTLTGFNCNVNSKLRTDGLGNVICSADNVNDGDFVIGNEYPLAGAGISVTAARTVNANDVSSSNELQVLSKIGNTISLSLGGGSVIDAVGITVETDPTVPANIKDGITWAEVSGKPAGFADNVDNIGITTQTCPAGQVLKSVGTNSKICVALPSGGVGYTHIISSNYLNFTDRFGYFSNSCDYKIYLGGPKGVYLYPWSLSWYNNLGTYGKCLHFKDFEKTWSYGGSLIDSYLLCSKRSFGTISFRAYSNNNFITTVGTQIFAKC